MKRQPPPSESVLRQLRQQIDVVDASLLRFLTQRAALALRVRRIKKRNGWKLQDPVREQAILRRMTHANPGPLTPQAVQAIYRTILTQMRRLGQKQ